MTSIVFALDKLTQERDSAIATLDRLKQLSSAEKEKLNDIVEKEYIMKFRAVLKQVAHYEKGILRAEAAGEQCPQAPDRCRLRPHRFLPGLQVKCSQETGVLHMKCMVG
eukprot:CAMPEP_0173372192 /NCGR_PEP_ID=MMETSP1144-20121109/27731_1 /TAXON_ID=483371 /ORGANISM="non described non described, Strain CCMP2298" /LENGTH=108 /DNA_ID=CAMNT_0014324079 /DNA_START=293 /DNA_END=619 /DNA_ORIENTATION=+